MPLKSNKRVKCSPLDNSAVKPADAPAFPSIDKGSELLSLPLELIMEIRLSHFVCLPIITGKIGYSLFVVDPRVSHRYLERTNVLCALSQTRRSWRNLIFPLLWERLEPCLTNSRSGNCYGASLIRKSALICENQEITSYVRCVQIRTFGGRNSDGLRQEHECHSHSLLNRNSSSRVGASHRSPS